MRSFQSAIMIFPIPSRLPLRPPKAARHRHPLSRPCARRRETVAARRAAEERLREVLAAQDTSQAPTELLTAIKGKAAASAWPTGEIRSARGKSWNGGSRVGRIGFGSGARQDEQEPPMTEPVKEVTPEFQRGWDAALIAARTWHKSQAKQSLTRARRSRFPTNSEREAEVHQRSAEMITRPQSRRCLIRGTSASAIRTGASGFRMTG